MSIQSCSKDTSNPAPEEKLATTELNIGDEIRSFIDFNENFEESSTVRSFSTGNTQKNDAIQDVENAMNYTYGWIGTKYSNYDTKRDTLRIPTTSSGDSLTTAEVNDLYNDIENRIACHYTDVSFSNKHVKFVNLEFVASSSTYIDVSVTDVVGEIWGITASGPPSVDFGVGEDWDAFYGSCSAPGWPVDGASPRIARHVTYNYSPQTLSPDYIYIDFHSVYHSDDYLFADLCWRVSCGGDGSCADDVPCPPDSDPIWCIDYMEGNNYTSAYGGYVLNYASAINETFIQFALSVDGISCPQGDIASWYNFEEGTTYAKKVYVGSGPTHANLQDPTDCSTR